MNETPGTALSTEIERFAALVQSLGIYEQVLYLVVCRVRARGKAKTAPLSVVSSEYQQALKPLGVFRDQMPSFWDTLGLLETAGLVTVRHRSNRILITDMGLPLDEVLAHLSGLDYAAELARRSARANLPRAWADEEVAVVRKTRKRNKEHTVEKERDPDEA